MITNEVYLFDLTQKNIELYSFVFGRYLNINIFLNILLESGMQPAKTYCTKYYDSKDKLNQFTLFDI